MTAIHLLQTAGAVIGLGLVILGLALLYLGLRSALPAYFKFRGTRVVTCPENGQTVAVAVDAKVAAVTALPRPLLRLESCTRWPEKQNCGQLCLDQIEASPEDCLVRNMLTHWYEGKICVFCRRPLAAIHWHDHKPALLSPEGRTVAWTEVPPEHVPRALATHEPVCWNCHVAETFRREHPELVTDRPPKPQEHRHHA